MKVKWKGYIEGEFESIEEANDYMATIGELLSNDDNIKFEFEGEVVKDGEESG